MAEIPERRVLRELLSKVKNKMYNSRRRYLDSAKRAADLLSRINRVRGKSEEDPALKGLGPFLDYTDAAVSGLLDATLTAFEDSDMYVGLLERLATEYDKTLTSIFKKAQVQKRKAKVPEEPPATIFA